MKHQELRVAWSSRSLAVADFVNAGVVNSAKFLLAVGMPARFAIVLGLALLLSTGCASTPFTQQGETVERSLVVDLTQYFGVPQEGSRVFLRTNLKDNKDAPTLYERRESATLRAEGRLSTVRSEPLASYLYPSSMKNRVVRFPWPDKYKPKGPGFFIEFDPPVAEWPARLRGNEYASVNADMNVYDRAGNLFARGTATRRVRLEGYETIEVGGIAYPDSLCLSSEIVFHFGWWATFRLFEKMWVSAEQGLLRRTERVYGTALLVFRFDSLYQYELVSGKTPLPIDQLATQAESDESQGTADHRPLPHWARLALYLDRDVPHPRLGGVLIEYDRVSEHP